MTGALSYMVTLRTGVVGRLPSCTGLAAEVQPSQAIP